MRNWQGGFQRFFQLSNGWTFIFALPALPPGISFTVKAVSVFAGTFTSNPTSVVPGFGAS
jgi:hypothetical protein